MTDRFRDGLREADGVFVFSGAGVSAESGIPTFRGNSAAIWAGVLGGFIILPIFGTPFGWNWIPFVAWPLFDRWLRKPIMAAQPNAFHLLLGSISDRVWVMTQNVDGLHQRGGVPASRVIELHGTVWRSVCLGCARILDETAPHAGEATTVPRCVDCGGWPRPDATLFTENLPERELERVQTEVFPAFGACRNPIVIVVGLSGAVPSADRYIEKMARRAPVFNINPGSSKWSDREDWIQIPENAAVFVERMQAAESII